MKKAHAPVVEFISDQFVDGELDPTEDLNTTVRFRQIIEDISLPLTSFAPHQSVFKYSENLLTQSQSYLSDCKE